MISINNVNAELIDDLEMYYSFDDSHISGDTIYDLSDNNHTGLMTGVTTGASGVIGEAFHFDGSQDYIIIPENLLLGAESFSISTWIKMDSSTPLQTIISCYSGSQNQWTFRLIYPNQLNEKINFGSWANNDNYVIADTGNNKGPDFYSNNQWHHVVITWAGEDTGKIYLDGVDETINFEYATSMHTHNTETTIGLLQSIGEYLNSDLDEMGVWHRALSEEEILELYNNNEGLAYPFQININADFEITSEDIIFSNDSIMKGTPVTITAFFKNLLDEDPEQILVRFYSGEPSEETYLGEDLVQIKDRSTFFAQLEWIPEIEGDYDIHVWVDADDQINEENEENNIAFKPISVFTLPDLRIRDQDIGFSNNHPKPGDNIQIFAMVRNIENLTAENFTVFFYDMRTHSILGEIEMSIEGLQTEVVIIPWTVTSPGEHEIIVIVDRYNIIEEIDETNNRASKIINVLNPHIPDIFFMAAPH